ncbi:hypothetical protein ACFL4E_02575 [Candidatus Omnitrophota bacterium]
MPDTFAITIIFIVLCTVIGAFLKGRSRDRCISDFSGFPVTLEKANGKVVWGDLRVENSGMELVYEVPYMDEADKHLETSSILYKGEYGEIKRLIRYIDALDEKMVAERGKDLEKTNNPTVGMRLTRRTRNFFGTVRDSLMEIANVLMGRMRGMGSVGKALQGQDKYVSQLQQQAGSALETSYEPILERYIGKRVILAVMEGDKKTEYSGFLKDYTTEFVEIMDVQLPSETSGESRTADIIFLRSAGTVRHLGE